MEGKVPMKEGVAVVLKDGETRTSLWLLRQREEIKSKMIVINRRQNS